MANRKGEQGEPTYTITSDEMEGKQNRQTARLLQGRVVVA